MKVIKYVMESNTLLKVLMETLKNVSLVESAMRDGGLNQNVEVLL